MAQVQNGWLRRNSEGQEIAARQHPVLDEPVSLAGNPQMPGIAISAVIDDGIGIANARFREATGGSRIEYAWFQDGVDKSGGKLRYGREFDKQEIDTLLGGAGDGVSVDEEAFYRALGAAGLKDGRPGVLARRATHGTLVADLATGGNGPENPIIAVQLPRDVTEDTSGEQLVGFAEDALRYIVDRADRIADARGTARLPLVINFSYGFIAGPHDGTHALERVMAEILAGRNHEREITAIVLPSGNSRESQCHALLEFDAPDAEQVLVWRVQPDDRTPSIVELYMPWSDAPPAASRATVRLATPDGLESPELDEVDGLAWEWPSTGPVRARISYQYLAGATARGRFVLHLAATRDLEKKDVTAPSGNWTVTVRNKSLGAVDAIHAYVQRDDTPFGYDRRGRQSRFDDAAYVRFTPGGIPVEEDTGTSALRRDGLINAMGTGAGSLVISGYDRRSGRVAKYAAGGPVQAAGGAAAPLRNGPDAMMPSDGSRVHRGVLGSTTKSGRLLALSGTSVAAPQVARAISRAMIDGSWNGKATLSAWAQDGTSTKPAHYPPLPDIERGGDGWIIAPPVHERTRFWA